jgi:hypothetical protein
MVKITTEFDEKKELIRLKSEADLIRHNYKMKELDFQNKNDTLRHEQEMERQRIKSAEIRKMQERKEFSNMRHSY